MKWVYLLLIPVMGMSQSYGLKTFIDAAQKNNGQIKAKEIRIKAGQSSVEAAQSAYWPTLDVGGSYSKRNPNYLVSPGVEATVFASVNLDLYDGGRKSAQLRAREYEKEASLFEKQAFEKSVTLQIVQHYFGIKQLQANLHALQERSKELKAQIERVKKFLRTGLATQEEVDKLQAVYDNNRYTMENTKLRIETSRENLSLITGLSVSGLKRNYFQEPKKVGFEWFDGIKILEANAKAVGENAKAIDAAYLPQVGISDTYYRSHFDDQLSVPTVPGIPSLSDDGFIIDHQNELKLEVHMRLFDNGKIAKESEAVRYRKLALLSELDHAKREQKMHFRLARQNLRTVRAKMKSAKSALKAAESTYRTIRKKFETGLVDDIAFLDALTQKTLAEARYKETIYDYEIKKSIYYYYAGKDPKEFIR